MSAEPAPPLAAPRPVKSRSRKRLALVLLVGAVAFGVWYVAIRTPEPRDDPGRFQGEWQLTVPADSAEAGKTTVRRTPTVIRVTGDRWVFLLNDKEQRKYTMTLRPDADPKEIDLTQLAPDDKPLIQKMPPPARPVVLRGIYTVNRDTAKIVAAVGDESRPTSLDATDGVTVWLLERVK